MAQFGWLRENWHQISVQRAGSLRDAVFTVEEFTRRSQPEVDEDWRLAFDIWGQAQRPLFVQHAHPADDQGNPRIWILGVG